MSKRVPLSILDLVSVSEGQGPGQAIGHALEAAVEADRLGYERLWYAEHHNTASVASAATQVLIGRAASLTSRIRVGSGGVMLPNHAPLMVAEQYGTLAQMFPDRIDLGLGRAPGTDPVTAHALNRTSADPQSFAEAIWDLVGWFSRGRSHSINIEAPMAAETRVPIWVLGSTTSGASIAGQLGLPFSIAAHFAPDQVQDAISVYRRMFDPGAPTAQISEPRVMVGVNVLVAETDEEAQFQFSTHQQMFLSVRRGTRHKLLPPVPLSRVGSVSEVQALDSMLRVRAVGSPETVRVALESLVERTGADELITVTYSYDPAVRLESTRLLAELWGLEAAS